jgi:hypothetical protein
MSFAPFLDFIEDCVTYLSDFQLDTLEKACNVWIASAIQNKFKLVMLTPIVILGGAIAGVFIAIAIIIMEACLFIAALL